MRLRSWRDDDVDELARLNADPDFTRYLGGGPTTLEETQRQLGRIRRHWEEHGFGLWAAEERATSRFVGRIGLQYHTLWPHDPEVGWALDPAVWGRGYATEGGAAALEHAFGALGFARVVSIVLPANIPSIRVMERLGLAEWRRLSSQWGELAIYAAERDSAAAESDEPDPALL